MERFIVAEVSKNWEVGKTYEGIVDGPISEHFAKIINSNFEKGYSLHSFQVSRTMYDKDHLNETVIAVFELTSDQLTHPVAVGKSPVA